MIRSLLVATQGLVGWISPTLLKIATQGLIDDDEGPTPRVFAFPKIEVDEDEPRKFTTMEVCMWAVGGGVIR